MNSLPTIPAAQAALVLLYTSASGALGQDWTQSTAPTNGYGWYAVASSADGTRLAAAIGGLSSGPITGPICISTDSGANRTAADSPTNYCASVAASADGCKLVAAVNGGGIYTRQATPAPKLNISLSDTNLLLSFPWRWRPPSAWSRAKRSSGSCSTVGNFTSSGPTPRPSRLDPSPANLSHIPS